MPGTALTDTEFGQQLADAQSSLLRWEAQPGYAVTVEAYDFELFGIGTPRPPEQLEWWTGWLNQIASQRARGIMVERTAVEDDPPTLYQRWRKWAAGRAERAGEVIHWMTAARAAQLGLSRGRDWWLIDGIKVIVMDFAPTGSLTSRTLITDPAAVSRYKELWDLATRDDSTAGQSAA